MSEPFSLVLPENIKFMLNQAKKTPAGIIVEVGVYKGGTAYHLNKLAEERGEELWLFDNFEDGNPNCIIGLDTVPIGCFNDCSYKETKAMFPNAKIFPGVFPDTLPSEVPPIAFVHVDCDTYESVKNCIIHLIPHMVTGGIMYFDDYVCLQGAIKAVNEECPERIILANDRAIYVKK